MKPLTLSQVDLYIQYALITVNIIITMLGVAMPPFFLLLAIVQLFINIYHFVTNLMHLYARHRSVGFTSYRQQYFWLTVIYVPVASLLTWLIVITNTDTLLMIFAVIIWLIVPQVVLYAYTYLCYSEFEFIEQNELHILK